MIRQHAPKAQDFTNRRYRHAASWMRVERTKNRTKSKVRARVEHSIGIIKRVFGLCQGALPRAEEKHPPPAPDLSISQPVRGAPSSAALRQGLDYPQCVSTHINNRTLPRQRAVTHPIARPRIFYVHSSCADPRSDVPAMSPRIQRRNMSWRLRELRAGSLRRRQ